MKHLRFNKNSILFAFAAIFIVLGVWGGCFTQIKWDTLDIIGALMHFDRDGVEEALNDIEDVSNKELRYHDLMMDIDSVKNNLLLTRIVIKDDTTVVKADSGSLCAPVNRLEDAEIEEIVSRIKKLEDYSERNGAHFLYCVAPKKEQYEQLPCNVDNYAWDNHDRFLRVLRESEIPTVDFSECLEKSEDALFFSTDHHWTTQSGFVAYSSLCRELSSRYGFEFNEQYTCLENFDVSTYSDLFLGSKGKKTGTYFSWQGADDFTLITPKFSTNMTEEHDVKREGSFEETVLFMQHLKKDYYHDNTYVTYSGGDFHQQIIENKQNLTGTKILIIRDSFACVVTPFLALQAAELYICDIRDYDYLSGFPVNLETYIQDIKPEYVIVLYSGVDSDQNAHGKFNFLPTTN